MTDQTDAFGQRPINDLLGEALRRHRLGSVRPLWADMPESPEKHGWRMAGRALLANPAPAPKPARRRKRTK